MFALEIEHPWQSDMLCMHPSTESFCAPTFGSLSVPVSGRYNHNSPGAILHSAPEEFNEVQFTVEFGQKNAQMPCSFDDFLNQSSLFFEVGLKIQDARYTASGPFNLTRVLAFHEKLFLPKSSLSENLIHSLWHRRNPIRK
jgi:hypothetical protein